MNETSDPPKIVEKRGWPSERFGQLYLSEKNSLLIDPFQKAPVEDLLEF
jgi:hypothetical protein